MSDKEDIREVIAAEKGKGRPARIAAKKLEQDLLRKFRKALDLENEKDFLMAMREIEPSGDPEKLKKALWIWRAHRRALPPSDRRL